MFNCVHPWPKTGKTILRGLFLLSVAVATGTLLLIAQPPGGAGKGKQKAKGPEPCERACLEDFANQYLDALVAHNPFGLPLAKGVKFTENGYELPMGDGLWNVATGLGRYRIYVADFTAPEQQGQFGPNVAQSVPQGGQVGLIATVYENQRPVTLALRLRIEDRKISEIETMVSRVSAPTGGGFGAPKGKGKGKGKGPAPRPVGAANLEQMFGPAADFMEAVPEAERSSRVELIDIANSYFDALEQSSGDIALFAETCDRIENGSRVTNNPGAAPAPRGTIDTDAMGCAEQITSQAFAGYQVVYPRRFPVIDEERQLVMAWAMYQQPGTVLTVESPGLGNIELPVERSQPAFVETVQIFKIENGRIRRMEGLTQTLPYGTPDVWFPDTWRKK